MARDVPMLAEIGDMVELFPMHGGELKVLSSIAVQVNMKRLLSIDCCTLNLMKNFL